MATDIRTLFKIGDKIYVTQNTNLLPGFYVITKICSNGKCTCASTYIAGGYWIKNDYIDLEKSLNSTDNNKPSGKGEKQMYTYYLVKKDTPYHNEGTILYSNGSSCYIADVSKPLARFDSNPSFETTKVKDPINAEFFEQIYPLNETVNAEGDTVQATEFGTKEVMIAKAKAAATIVTK